MFWYVVVAVVFLIGGFALYKHRQQIKMAAAAEAYRVKQFAQREADKAETEAKNIYQSTKNRLP